MKHKERVGSSELLKNQGVVHVKERGYFPTINLEFRAWLGLLHSYFIDICYSRILMTAGTHPLHEAMASQLVSVNVRLNTLLGGQGTQRKVKPARHSAVLYAILLLIISFVESMITGAYGELHNEAGIQSCTCAAPHVWEIRDYALQALAVTTLTVMTTVGVLVVGRLFHDQPLVPAIPIAIPAAIPATILEVVQALPLIPVVQGGGDDIDDMLARAPIPTRLNSPLSWL